MPRLTQSRRFRPGIFECHYKSRQKCLNIWVCAGIRLPLRMLNVLFKGTGSNNKSFWKIGLI
jgi:hypothetical protein